MSGGEHVHAVRAYRVELGGEMVPVVEWCEDCGAQRVWLFDSNAWGRWRRPGRRARRTRRARDRQLGLFASLLVLLAACSSSHSGSSSPETDKNDAGVLAHVGGGKSGGKGGKQTLQPRNNAGELVDGGDAGDVDGGARQGGDRDGGHVHPAADAGELVDAGAGASGAGGSSSGSGGAAAGTGGSSSTGTGHAGDACPLVFTGCDNGLECCSGTCVDTSSACFPSPCIPGTKRDADNCGGCGVHCATTFCCAN